MKRIMRGFTLIELMIVVAIIAIIAAIAIPSILRARMSSNEVSAVGTLKTLLNSQATWRSNDVDKNGVQDHWVADVSGLYTFTVAGALAPVQHVSLDVARADQGANAGAAACVAGSADTSIVLTTAGKAGYRFAMFTNDPNGSAYAVATDTALDAQHNSNLFGYQAFPEAYAASGVNMFIISESGAMWRSDASAQGVSTGGVAYVPLVGYPPNPPQAAVPFSPTD